MSMFVLMSLAMLVLCLIFGGFLLWDNYQQHKHSH